MASYARRTVHFRDGLVVPEHEIKHEGGT
jgi:hypothetical protein